MSEKIVNGYLISEYEYGEYDKILKFIINENRFISCLAKGLRKSGSKNARQLFFGILTEIQFFEARLNNKLSKLKKVNLIEQLDQTIIENYSLVVLNYLYEKILHDCFQINVYTLYKNFLDLIKTKKYDSEFLINYFLIRCQTLFGFKLIYKKCSICGTQKQINSVSIENNGILCRTCSLETQLPKWKKEAIFLFYFLNSNNIEKAYEYKIGNKLVFVFMREIYLKLIGITIPKLYE